MIAGPGWKGEIPKGITKVIHCETSIASAQFRTQLFNAADLDNVKAIQKKYIVKSLSAFLGQPAPKPAAAIDFPKPLTPDAQKTSLQFFNNLNFTLQIFPTDSSEIALRKRFEKIGIKAGVAFDTTKLSPEVKQAFHNGIKDAWTEFAGLKKRIEKGEIVSGDLFGTRAYLKNNYLYRMVAAVLGIYGNTKEEAMYPAYYVDGTGQKLNGVHNYTIHFAPGQLPPVNSFWSITMYDQPARLLVANPIDRYLINSTMLPQLKKDKDGGLTLLLQNQSPGKGKELNWLPAPNGPFSMIMRFYWPKQAALDGKWVPPILTRVN